MLPTKALKVADHLIQWSLLSWQFFFSFAYIWLLEIKNKQTKNNNNKTQIVAKLTLRYKVTEPLLFTEEMYLTIACTLFHNLCL